MNWFCHSVYQSIRVSINTIQYKSINAIQYISERVNKNIHSFRRQNSWIKITEYYQSVRFVLTAYDWQLAETSLITEQILRSADWSGICLTVEFFGGESGLPKKVLEVLEVCHNFFHNFSFSIFHTSPLFFFNFVSLSCYVSM